MACISFVVVKIQTFKRFEIDLSSKHLILHQRILMFQKGDCVKAIDENIKGKIKKVNNREITIVDENGFDYIFDVNELILDEKLTIEKVDHKEAKKFTKPKFKTFRKSHRSPYLTREVDLHIEKLIEKPQLLNQSEKLQTQLKTAIEEIEKAMNEDQIRLILIHGYGKGILKQELTNILYRYSNIEFYDASFKEYHGDAIEVKFISTDFTNIF